MYEYVPLYVHTYICPWIVRLFHVLVLVNNSAVNIRVQIIFLGHCKTPLSFNAWEPDAFRHWSQTRLTITVSSVFPVIRLGVPFLARGSNLCFGFLPRGMQGTQPRGDRRPEHSAGGPSFRTEAESGLRVHEPACLPTGHWGQGTRRKWAMKNGEPEAAQTQTRWRALESSFTRLPSP